MIARTEVSPRHNRYRAGITIPEVLVVTVILALLFLLLLPAVQNSRESARRSVCMSNFRQIGLAVQNYESTYRVFPGNLMPWTEAILPYLEQDVLYRRLQGWHQEQLDLVDVRSASVPVYICPSDSMAQDQRGWTPSYVLNDGWDFGTDSNGFFRATTRKTIGNDWKTFYRQTTSADFTDGLSNTAAVCEKLVAPDAYVLFELKWPHENPQLWNRLIRETWMADGPEDLELFAYRCEFESITPVTRWVIRRNELGSLNCPEYNHVLGPNRNTCRNGSYDVYAGQAITSSSLHPGGVNLLLGDGAVKFTSNSIDIKVWRALGSRNGGEAIGSF